MIVFVVGTGTDVGKTHVTCALLAEAAARGLRASAYKPVITGVLPGPSTGREPTDAELHARYASEAPPPPSHVFPEPISPHLAARNAGVLLDVAQLASAAIRHAGSCDLLFVEAAGGLFSPIGEESSSADLAASLRARAPCLVLLVAPDRIGVLHDIRATLLAATHVGCVVDAVVLSAPGLPDASTGRNRGELERLGITTVAAVFPRAAPDHPTSRAAAHHLLASWRLGGSFL